MGLQNRESSYIQAASDRLDTALPQNIFAVTPSATAFEESALYIDADDTLTVETGGGQTRWFRKRFTCKSGNRWYGIQRSTGFY